MKLTGERRTLIPTLRTKEAVDHAGPSQPLVPLKEPSIWLENQMSTCQNKNLSIAQRRTRTTDAMVV